MADKYAPESVPVVVEIRHRVSTERRSNRGQTQYRAVCSCRKFSSQWSFSRTVVERPARAHALAKNMEGS